MTNNSDTLRSDPGVARPRRVTAADVADLAGVSRSAVSRAFTDGAYLDAEKRRKIREVAAQLGYQPNALAAGLQGGRSNLVAIFAGNTRNVYDTDFVSHLVSVLNGLNKWPILIDGESADEDVLRYPLDALILRGGSMSAEMVESCAKIGIPMISSGRPFVASGVDNVCCRHEDGMRMATKMLIAKGRKRFGYIGGPVNFYSSLGRRFGVVQTLEEAGLSIVSERVGNFTAEAGHQMAREMLGKHPIDALICANDATAIGALTAARELGTEVPEALSVVGFDDISMAKWPIFDLTTVRNPIDAAVAGIIDLLERRLEDPYKASETILVAPTLIERGTH